MIDFLLGVPGKLKAISDHLTTYWTSTRAAKLDLLTVAPAPASTALTNATWTDTRAGWIDTNISSRAPYGPRLKPPIAANYGDGGQNGTLTTQNQLMLNITGSGIVFRIGIRSSSGTNSVSGYVVIDGITLPALSSISNTKLRGLVGEYVYFRDNNSQDIDIPVYEYLPFTSSLQIYGNANGVYAAPQLVWKIYRTS